MAHLFKSSQQQMHPVLNLDNVTYIHLDEPGNMINFHFVGGSKLSWTYENLGTFSSDKQRLEILANKWQ
ncbi:hypothetical protein F0L74_25600 [Chitinophaga agrisoli]|uniref:KTSC domain-containing protein n=1 Tax=Chitinophaga agrisoli TaxID=2607653 RepID=A0A5B2VKT3_9BACT|nr:hypothetical protein [Chitinophaga agrisoli]KAA2239575.1 hypothetical protein F0L74_25600 [Chitinophaga agrisoli]